MFDRVVPWKTVFIKNNALPWFNDKVKKAIETRNLYFEKWKIRKGELDWSLYKKYRNLATQVIRESKSSYLKERLDPSLHPKIFWKNVRALGVGKCKNNINIDFSANDLNKYFHSNFTSPDDQNIYVNSKIKNGKEFCFRNIDENELCEALLSIKSNAVGLDEINLKFVKLLYPLLSSVILHIFNHILTTSSYPVLWKGSKIIPVPKIKSPSEITHYRPISILSTLSKAFEKIMKNQISEFLFKNNLYDKFQSGYRKHHSTNTALLKICDDIRENIDSRKASILVLLDFSKAFDTINHTTLCTKLVNQFNFSNTAVKMIESYLTGRFQVVSANGVVSEALPVLSGVPQGSVLGPLLFCLYISDLIISIRSSQYHFYADDLQLYRGTHVNSINKTVSEINDDLARISVWAVNNSLKLNESKSQAIIIFKNQIESVDPIKLNNSIIPFSNMVKN